MTCKRCKGTGALNKEYFIVYPSIWDYYIIQCPDCRGVGMRHFQDPPKAQIEAQPVYEPTKAIPNER